MTRYQTTELYGGKVSSELPEQFVDVNKFREIPGNQEVYIDEDGYTSIIFDILERVGGPGTGPEIDGAALTVHLEELVGEDKDTVKVWNTTETQFSRMGEKYPAYTLIATQNPRSDERDRSASPDFTAIIISLLRIEEEETDVLITVNVPHIKGEYNEEDVDLELGKQGKLIGDAVEYAARIWESFKIRDWTLLRGEDEA